MEEVFLPRRSWKRNSIRFVHQQIHSQRNCRPRIPHAQCPCGFSHRLLRSAIHGVNFFCRCFHVPWRLYHQWLLEPSTLHYWRWSTIACSIHGSYWGEDYHSRTRVALSCLIFSWKHIPAKWKKKSTILETIWKWPELTIILKFEARWSELWNGLFVLPLVNCFFQGIVLQGISHWAHCSIPALFSITSAMQTTCAQLNTVHGESFALLRWIPLNIRAISKKSNH